MRFSISLFVALAAAVVSASPEADASNLVARQYFGGGYGGGYGHCGPINGNCYDSGCAGDQSYDGVTCSAGTYAGCECGYNCGATNGPCSANGCNGVNGRCTNNYNGCNCNGY